MLAKRGHAFRVITPYDAQRSKLEDAIKSHNLPWEDKVFNVDSFQGNEEDVIIISLVRTKKVGFLSNKRSVVCPLESPKLPLNVSGSLVDGRTSCYRVARKT